MGKFEQHNFFRKTALTTFWAMCGEIGLLFSLSSGRTACTHECIMHQASVSNDTFFFFFSPDVSFDQICNKSEALKNSNIKFLSAPPALPHVLLPTYLPQTSLNGVVQHAAVKITICLNFTKAFSRSSHFHFQFISSLSRPLCRKCHSSLLFSK